MREIKFRAWDKEGKHMVNVDVFDFRFLKLVGKDERGYLHDMDLKYYELMQYSGLKDKDGTEIYEGDIVRYKNKIGAVVWDKYRFNVSDFFESHYDYPGEAFSENISFEVISNIYENPELLQEASE